MQISSTLFTATASSSSWVDSVPGSPWVTWIIIRMAEKCKADARISSLVLFLTSFGVSSSQAYRNQGRLKCKVMNLYFANNTIVPASAVEGRSLCNHRRAYKFFTDSVSPKCRFPAFPCDQGYEGLLKGDCFPCGTNGMDRPCGDMGYYSNESPARGQLYLMTRDEEPFCAYQYQIKVYNSKSERSARSYGKLQVSARNESFAE